MPKFSQFPTILIQKDYPSCFKSLQTAVWAFFPGFFSHLSLPFLHIIPWFSTEQVKSRPRFSCFSHCFFYKPFQDSRCPGISPAKELVLFLQPQNKNIMVMYKRRTFCWLTAKEQRRTEPERSASPCCQRASRRTQPAANMGTSACRVCSNLTTVSHLRENCLDRERLLQDGCHPGGAEGYLPWADVGSVAARPPSSAPRLACKAHDPSFLGAGSFLTLDYLTGFPGVSTVVSMEVSSLQ